MALAAVEKDTALLALAATRGAVWLRRRRSNGQFAKLARIRNLDDPIIDGSELFANLNPQVLAAQCEQPTLIEQHPNYSFWFKPRGVLSQGSKWGDHTAMPSLVAAASDRVCHLVHRLDRTACGVMVIAHTRPAVRELTALFAKRRVVKRYIVQVHGQWKHALPYLMDAPLDEREAITEVLDADVNADKAISELRVRIHSGRKHQIRRHLAEAHYPVVGDSRYGEADKDVLLALMATDIEFDCPFSAQRISCQVPTSLRQLL